MERNFKRGWEPKPSDLNPRRLIDRVRDLLVGANGFLSVGAGVLAAGGMLVAGVRTEALGLSPFAANVYRHTALLAAVWFLMAPIVDALWRPDRPALSSLLIRFLAVNAVLLGVVNWGDDIVRAVQEAPSEAVALVTSLLLVSSVLRLRPPTSVTETAVSGVADAAINFPERRPPTARDNWVTAAHEAGHALVCAALGRLPNEFKAAINERDENGVLGYVSSVAWGHLLVTREFSEWRMLMLLGGREGERALLGEMTLGATSDYRAWLSEARNYLTNGFGETYFYPPENEAEAARNQATLDVLRGRQCGLLAHFYDVNKDVLEGLAETLVEKRSLSKGELVPFMQRVLFVAGFPKPNGEFVEFCPE